MQFCAVLKGCKEYQWKHALALRAAVHRHAPGARFVLLTDCLRHAPNLFEQRKLNLPLEGWWAKMELLSPENSDLAGSIYLDLDTVIVGDLSWLTGASGLRMLRDFYFPERSASGMMCWTKEAAVIAHSAFLRDMRGIMANYRKGGDQAFLAQMWPKVAYWQDDYPGKIVSYKVDVLPNGTRDGTSIVCFHGKPRPWEVVDAWAAKQYATCCVQRACGEINPEISARR